MQQVIDYRKSEFRGVRAEDKIESELWKHGAKGTDADELVSSDLQQ